MNSLCIDVGYNSVNKHGEELCGDHVEVVKDSNNSLIMVLADGMGSGVKANILSILTAEIISTMIQKSMPIEDCVLTIASTLPVCEERHAAYSTFTIVKITDMVNAEIIQYDNPKLILLRNGENFEYPAEEIIVDNKKIKRSKITLDENDILISMSDGAIHAGAEQELNYNWTRNNIIDFLQVVYKPEFTAKTISTMLLEQCVKLYGGLPSDDTTISAIKIKKREIVNVLIGPPLDPADVGKMMKAFFEKDGKHIVCGGTTSQLAAEFLNEEIKTNTTRIDPEIPPTTFIHGVDLVTEGVVTISKVLKYAENYLGDNDKFIEWAYKKDGASLISRMLFENATDINFFIGKAVNPAHQTNEMPINFSRKMYLIDKLSKILKKIGKTINIKYY